MAQYRATATLDGEGWEVQVEGVGRLRAGDLVEAREKALVLIARLRNDRTPELDLTPVVQRPA